MSTRRLAICLGLVVTGCTLGPDYQRPELDTPDAFIQSIDEGESIANLRWWELFEDPALRSLVEVALVENQNIAIAAARVEEARAQLGFVRADQFPRIDAGGQASRGNTAELISPELGITETYALSGTLSFEVDLWGKLRRSTEAARAELLATEEAKRVVTITLIADVASAYLLLRDLDARRAIAEQTVKSRQESLAIIEARFEKGTVPMIDVNQAEIEEADAAAELASLEREVVQAENLLSILIGRNPGPIVRGQTLDQQALPPSVPPGLPTDLLERRPDVRQAEFSLAGQTARIGVAQALRLPSLNLTGTGGLVSNDIDDLFDSDSELWTIGGDFFGPLFDMGKSKRQVEIERARTEQLLQEYELTVRQALREVEDSLVAIRTYRDELVARERQAAAARSAATLSRARYDGGVTSYLEVLDSERSQFQAELAESQTRRAQLVSVIELYKALGGGWDPDVAKQTAYRPSGN